MRDGAWLRDLAQRPWSGPSLPWLALPRARLLAELTRLHCFAALHRAFVESLESESLSRLARPSSAAAAGPLGGPR